MKKNKFEILNMNQKQKEWNYMNSAKNITLGWVPTRGPHMSEADAARSCLPIGPTVSLGRICSWNQPNAARMTTNLPSAGCGCYLTYIVRLAQRIEITNTFPLVVKWFGFPRQVDPKHLAPDRISPLFLFFILFCYFLSFRFLFTRKCFMWQILSSMQETQQQSMYICKNSQVAPSERYHIRKHMVTPKISCGWEFCPTSFL
jgi:hypothetical protein